jgi:hypothetical protein
MLATTPTANPSAALRRAAGAALRARGVHVGMLIALGALVAACVTAASIAAISVLPGAWGHIAWAALWLAAAFLLTSRALDGCAQRTAPAARARLEHKRRLCDAASALAVAVLYLPLTPAAVIAPAAAAFSNSCARAVARHRRVARALFITRTYIVRTVAASTRWLDTRAAAAAQAAW